MVALVFSTGQPAKAYSFPRGMPLLSIAPAHHFTLPPWVGQDRPFSLRARFGSHEVSAKWR